MPRHMARSDPVESCLLSIGRVIFDFLFDRKFDIVGACIK